MALLTWKFNVIFLSWHIRDHPHACRYCLKVGRCNGMGKVSGSTGSWIPGHSSNTLKEQQIFFYRERGTYKNYQWFAGSHLLGSPGSTQPLALQYSATSKRGSEKPGTDPRLFTPWLTSSQSPPIRCHLHPRSCTKSARQCVNLLSEIDVHLGRSKNHSVRAFLWDVIKQQNIFLYLLSSASRVHKNDQHLILNEPSDTETLL